MGDQRIMRLGIRGALLAAIAPSCALMLALPGCGGCSAKPAEKPATAKADDKARGKPKAKPKADFSQMRLTVVPGDPQDPLRTVKPYHWTAATLDAQANNFDFKGNLTVRASDRDGQPLSVDGTPFYLAVNRPAVLPKGQKKQLDVTLFLPRTLSRPWVQSQLRDDGSGIEVKREQEQLLPMPAYQYDLVVLARWPQRYRYLMLAEAVRPVTDDISAAEDGFLYRVIARAWQLGHLCPASLCSGRAWRISCGMMPHRKLSITIRSRPCWIGCTGAAT